MSGNLTRVYIASEYSYFLRMRRLLNARIAARIAGNEVRRRACTDAFERLWKAHRAQ